MNQIIQEAWNDQLIDAPKSTDSESLNEIDVNILQAEAISFLEFAATLNENSNNLVSKFSPALAKILLSLF
jgi:hypothetical protein